MERQGTRGLTLGEILVVCAVLGLLLALALNFLVTIFRSTGRAGLRSQVQTQGLLLSEEMLKVLRSTGEAGLTLHEDTEASGFFVVGLQTVTTTGQQVWEDRAHLYYWRKNEQTLHKNACPPLLLGLGLTLDFAPDHPPKPTPDQFTALFAENGRTLSDHVANFAVSKNEGMVTFDLRLEKEEIRGGRVEAFSVRRELGFKS